MPVSYPLTLPSTPGIRDIEWLPDSSVETSRSTTTFVSQTYDWGSKVRRVRLEFPPMKLAEAKAWQAWVYKLNGLEGTFYLSDTVGAAGLGTVTGTPLVNGADQIIDELGTDGWGTGDNVYAGDWISIENQLYTILEDATESSGSMTLTLWPEAKGPADNATISYGSAAVGIFRLEEIPTIMWDITRLQSGFVLLAIEDDNASYEASVASIMTTMDSVILTTMDSVTLELMS